MRIAIVDDSRSVHNFLKIALGPINAQLNDFYDGSELLQCLNGGDEVFDLIMLDWEMPQVSGIEVLMEIAKRKLSTPVLMMTSKTSMSDIVEAIQNGARDYMMKPFTEEIVREKIGNIVRESVPAAKGL